MMRTPRLLVAWILWAAVIVSGIAYGVAEPVAVAQQQTPQAAPIFELDRSWPKPLPNNWMFGQVWGVAVDSKDHVWVLNNPKGGWPIYEQTAAEIKAAGRVPAPPVVEFDAQGNVVQGWGGQDGPGYNWVQVSNAAYPYGSPAEHGIFVDYKDNVWISGNGHLVLKFTSTGKFLLQIGVLWQTAGSNDRRLLGNPTNVTVDPKTNELYVADGYVNHRVIVFDADTGAYKRHWGAYGLKPSDGPPAHLDPNPDDNLVPDSKDSVVPGRWPLAQWLFPVHDVRVSKDGFVYACDRQHNRVQVFQTNGKFVKEVIIKKGGAGEAAFSADPEQRYLYVGTSVLRRSDLEQVGSIAASGGHYIAVDSKGNFYTSGGGKGRPDATSVQPYATGVPQRYLFKVVGTTAAGGR